MKNRKENQARAVRKRIPYKKAEYKKWKLAGTVKNVTFKHKLLMYVTTLAVAAYVFWRIFFTMPLEYGIPSVIAGVLLLAGELSSFTITLSNFRESTHYILPDLPEIPQSWYPHVDVFVTTHNEDRALMYKTLNGCTFMEYPDPGKMHIWLCDDKNRDEMRELAEELGVGYCGMVGNKHAKAGNLNNAMAMTSAPLVVTFDADMIPSSDFLMRMVPYFFLPYVEKQEDGSWRILDKSEIDPDYQIGFVQSPQSFYNPDLFQYNLYSETNIPNEQDFFFTEVNVAKNNDNVSQYAGSNTMLSRKALEAVGGFAHESITEDFLTGLMILQAGYRNLAIPDQLAHGLCPDTIGSLMKQRERWARGNIQVFKILKVWTSTKLNFWQKFELTGALCYWFSFLSRLIFILAPIAAVLFNIRVVDAPVWQILVFWLPHYILYYFATRVFSSRTRSNHWSAVVDTIMAPYLSLPTILESLGFTQQTFVVTDKSKGDDAQRWRTGLYVIPHVILLIFSGLSIFILIRQSIALNTVYNPIVLFWLFAGSKNLLFAIFFMLGRVNARNTERFFDKLPVWVDCFDIEYHGHTVDFSEGGLAVVFNEPIKCKADTMVTLTVSTELYSAYLKCRVANVKQVVKDVKGKKTTEWQYGFVIVEMDEHNKRQYYQILYDRPHSLPKKFKADASVFDDINTNLMRRTRRKEYNFRKMPRLTVELPFKTREGMRGTLHDFNFEFASISLNQPLDVVETLTLSFGGELELVLMPSFTADGDTTLYRIVNSEDILNKPNFTEIMEAWTKLQDVPANEKPRGSGYITTPNNPPATESEGEKQV